MPVQAGLVAMAALGAVGAACGSKTDLVIGSNPNAAGSNGAGDGPDGAVPEAGRGGTSGAAGSAGAAGAEDCDPNEFAPPLSLAHRYSFSGTGNAIVDSVGGVASEGTLIATDASALDGSGALQLAGYDGYVDLPNGLISSLSEVTLMTWTSWTGGGAWQRIFDFGNTSLGEDPPWKPPFGSPAGTPALPVYGGANYLAAVPYSAWPPSKNLGLEFRSPSTPTVHYGAAEEVKDGNWYQITVVFTDLVGARLYLNAQLLGTLSTPKGTLAALQDVNNWLGRSQTANDPAYHGAYTEFRIYSRALSQCAIANELAAGSDSPLVSNP